MSNEQQASQAALQEQEIDLMELAKKVWDGRKLILKVCGIGAVVGLIIAFSIPKEYTAQVMIAPESTGTSSSRSSSVSTLASMAGINLSSGSTRDAIYPDLYPDIVSSTPFLIGLFDIPVHQQKDTVSMPLSQYMTECQRIPWWSYITSAPFRLIGWTLSLFKSEAEEEEAAEEKVIDPFQLTRTEAATAGAINAKIKITVEKKTAVTTLAVTMQDPLIAGVVADSVCNRLQRYVTDYRTSKARQSLDNSQRFYQEAKADYDRAMEIYAKYADSNMGLSQYSSRAELEKLQNEMNLAYSAYNQMSQQLRAARLKVDETTPVFTVIQPASVPLRASKPGKMIILVGCIFLCGVGCVGWILFVREFYENWRRGKSLFPAADSKQTTD